MVNKLPYGPKVPFTNKRLPGLSKPQRGDIIVFIFPDDPKRDFIKRLIAFGGELVEIRDGNWMIPARAPVSGEIPGYYKPPSLSIRRIVWVQNTHIFSNLTLKF